MEGDGDEVHGVALATLTDPDHSPGCEKEGPGGLRRAGAEGERSGALDADELLFGGRVEVRSAVDGDISEGVEAERHGCGDRTSA